MHIFSDKYDAEGNFHGAWRSREITAFVTAVVVIRITGFPRSDVTRSRSQNFLPRSMSHIIADKKKKTAPHYTICIHETSSKVQLETNATRTLDKCFLARPVWFACISNKKVFHCRSGSSSTLPPRDRRRLFSRSSASTPPPPPPPS